MSYADEINREQRLQDLRDDLAALTDKFERFEESYAGTTEGRAARTARRGMDVALCDLNGEMGWDCDE